MSERFESVGTDPDIDVVPWVEAPEGGPWYEDWVAFGEHRVGEIALVIGDPEATALSIEGTPEQVLAFLDRARGEVQQYMVRVKGGGA